MRQLVLSCCILFAVWLVACNDNPAAPEVDIEGRGLKLDTATGIYSDPLNGAFFADIPTPYQTFYRHCTACHSNQIKSMDARGALNLNNWEQIRAYGPSRLVLLAKTHSRPLASGAVPDSDIQRVQDWLVAGMPPADAPSVPVDSALDGTHFGPARAFVTRYCADCHTSGGLHRLQPIAYGNTRVKLDTYAGWLSVQNLLLVRLDPAEAAAQGLPSMPPEGARFFPTAEERRLMLDWLRKGSPNTPEGG